MERSACGGESFGPASGKPSQGASDPIDWRSLISRVASALGVTPLTVRQDMTLDDVLDLHDYWQDHPPVQWMVQAYLDIKPRSRDSTSLRDRLASMAGAQDGGTLSPLYRDA